MSRAQNPTRDDQGKGHATVVGRACVWSGIWLAAALMMGACSSSEHANKNENGGARAGGANGAVTLSTAGGGNIGYSLASRSSGSSAGSASFSSSSASQASSSDSTREGGSAQTGGSTAGGGRVSSSSASSGSGSSGGAINSSSASVGGAGITGTPPTMGGSVPAVGGAMSTRSSLLGGSANAGGGRAGSSNPSSTGSSGLPAGDAGVSPLDAWADAKAGSTDCSFFGGSVTATLYPDGLTLRRACSPYTVSTISVYDEGLLTIEPGVTVRFTSGNALFVGVQGPGRLVAVGTPDEGITLTSSEAQPSPGFWRGIVFGGGTASGSKMAYTQITAAGHDRDGCIVGTAELPAYALTIDRVTIDKVGDGANGIMVLGEKSAVTITNSTFVDVPVDRYPISVRAASYSAIGTGNSYPAGSAIEVMGGTIDTTASWATPGLPVVVTGDIFVQGANNPVLTLGAGMTLKFGVGVAIQVGQNAAGKVAIAGTGPSSRVTLTALANPPKAGDWAGLQIWDYGRATISYADFRYGGNNTGFSKGNVTVESIASTVQLAVDHSSFADSNGWGIYVPCAASLQNAAIITVDTNTTYANNALGTKGPGLTCSN